MKQFALTYETNYLNPWQHQQDPSEIEDEKETP
jgi:hypothetical protein